MAISIEAFKRAFAESLPEDGLKQLDKKVAEALKELKHSIDATGADAKAVRPAFEKVLSRYQAVKQKAGRASSETAKDLEEVLRLTEAVTGRLGTPPYVPEDRNPETAVGGEASAASEAPATSRTVALEFNVQRDKYSSQSDDRFIERATVSVGEETRTTDSSGMAYFEVAPGVHPYHVSAAGFADLTGNVDVSTKSDVKRHGVVLESAKPLQGDVVMHVLDGQTEQPIVEAFVRFGDEVTTTDTNGEARFVGIPYDDEPYMYLARAEGFEDVTGQHHHDSRAGEHSQLRIELRPVAAPSEGSAPESPPGGGVPSAQPPGSITLKFNVQGAGQFVENATVTLAGDTAKTDGSGNVEFSVAPGVHPYTVSARGYQMKAGDVGISADEEVQYHGVVLSGVESDEGDVVVIVRDKATGRPLDRCMVRFADELGRTNARGEARFIGVRYDMHRVVVMLDGYTTHISDVSHSKRNPGGTIEIKLQSSGIAATPAADVPPIRYEVVVYDAGSEGDQTIEGAEVQVGEVEARTHRNGNAILMVSPGSYDYLISADGYHDLVGTVEVSDELQHLQARLLPKKPGPLPAADVPSDDAETPPGEELRELMMLVEAGEGQPIEGAIVKLNDDSQVTGRDGWTKFMVRPGPYVYEVSADGFQSRTGKLEMPDEEQFARGVTLDPIVPEGDAVVTVRVRHAVSHEPIKMATVRFGGDAALTDKDGETRFLAVKFGKHHWNINCDDNFEKPHGALVVRHAEMLLEIDLKPARDGS